MLEFSLFSLYNAMLLHSPIYNDNTDCLCDGIGPVLARAVIPVVMSHLKLIGQFALQFVFHLRGHHIFFVSKQLISALNSNIHIPAPAE